MLSLCSFHSFDFCMPPKEEVWKNSPAENLGQVVFGERIRPSIYKVPVLRVWTVLSCIIVIGMFKKKF